MRFSDDDAKRLAAFRDRVAPHHARIAQEFYERIREHEEAHAVLTGEEQIARLQGSLVRWLDGTATDGALALPTHVLRRHARIARGMNGARVAGMAAVSVNEEVWSLRRRMVDDLLSELREHALAVGDRRPVELVETHVSWVLLGPDAYKIKKPITLPFLDFSRFEAREEGLP